MAKKHPPLGDMVKSRARRLRGDATFPERLLWGRLRGRRLAGLKFRRQHPIGPYVADFFCHEHALVVELDGASHDGRADYDEERSEYIQSKGLQVWRVANDDVLRDLDVVLEGILLTCGIDPDSPAPASHVARPASGAASPRPSPGGRGGN